MTTGILAQGDNAALMTEIDNTSEAYESMQSSNTGLVRQLGERDARISQLMGEQLRHDQAIARGKADRELAETASRTAQQHKQVLEQRVHELQVDLQVLIVVACLQIKGMLLKLDTDYRRAAAYVRSRWTHMLRLASLIVHDKP